MLYGKHLHNLRKALFLQYYRVDKIRSVLTLAGLEDIGPNYDDPGGAWIVWGETLDAVKGDHEMFKQLMKTVVDDTRLDIFKHYYTEITSSRDKRLNQLAEAVILGKCVLFLGPEVLKVRDGNELKPFNKWMAKELRKKMEGKNVYFHDKFEDDLSYMAECYRGMPQYSHGDVANFSLSEYNRLTGSHLVDHQIYEQLAKLPFDIVINANPDSLLKHYIDQQEGADCGLRYYDISNKEAEPDVPIGGLSGQAAGEMRHKTILYNIFGSFQNASSILHTESEFLNFINRVTMGNPRLDNSLLAEFNEKDTYLFLGFDFEQWYFKVLFHLFRLKKTDFQAVSCNFYQLGQGNGTPGFNPGISPRTLEFYEEEFRMFFVDANLLSFITDLNNKLIRFRSQLV